MRTKLLGVGILSLVAMAWSAADAQAGLFGHRNKNGCTQYNAFSPYCCGDVVCGCCDAPHRRHGHHGWGGCCGGCGPVSQSCGLGTGAPGAPTGMAGAPVIVPDNSGYAPLPVIRNTTYMGQQLYGVQPTGYFPGYYPQASYPMNYNPYPMYPSMPAPSYWYGSR